MIEIVVFAGSSLIERAEADSAEGALLAARTLWRESRDGGYANLLVRFYAEGKLLRETAQLY